jgi:hypothetical protein
MSADEWLAAVAKQTAQHERNDDDVVELTRDAEEVCDEVERKGEVAGQGHQESLLRCRAVARLSQERCRGPG